MNREELIIRTSALAGDYYHNVCEDDGSEIIRTFSEYFDLIKDENVIDKQVVANIALIRASYLRAANDEAILQECQRGASKMDMFLQSKLESFANPAVVEIMEQVGEEDYAHGIYDDIDDLCRQIASRF